MIGWGSVVEGLVVAIPVGVASGFLGHHLALRRYERERSDRLQPLINRITVRLLELARRVERYASSEWEQAYSGYDEVPTPDELEELADQAAAVSVQASFLGRELVRSLERFQEFIQYSEHEARKAALEIMELAVPPKPGTRERGEYEHLLLNQEFHIWRERLWDIEDKFTKLAEELGAHSNDDETLGKLREVRGVFSN